MTTPNYTDVTLDMNTTDWDNFDEQMTQTSFFSASTSYDEENITEEGYTEQPHIRCYQTKRKKTR